MMKESRPTANYQTMSQFYKWRTYTARKSLRTPAQGRNSWLASNSKANTSRNTNIAGAGGVEEANFQYASSQIGAAMLDS